MPSAAKPIALAIDPALPAAPPIQRNARWRLVYAEPKRQEIALRWMEKAGFWETYAPTMARPIRHARKTTMATQYIFGRYIFVRFDHELEDAYGIRSAPGVVDLIPAGTASGYAEISDSAMAALRQRIAQEIAEIEAMTAQADGLAPGQERAILAGPFASFTGRIVDLDEKAREALILASIFGRETPITLPFDHIGEVVTGQPPQSRRDTRRAARA